MSRRRCFEVPGLGRVHTDGRPPSPRDLAALRSLADAVRRAAPPVGPGSADPAAPANRQAFPSTFRGELPPETNPRDVSRRAAPATEDPRP